MIRILKLIFLGLIIFFIKTKTVAQGNIDSLKNEIKAIQLDVENIHLNSEQSKDKFQKGIFVATLGYSITIAGGLMLGRENDETGQVLLVAGGVGGAIGTYMLVDAFKYLGRTRRQIRR